MTIRAKLYTAIVVTVAGLALTVGVGARGMSRLGDRFDRVERAADARALALQLKFDVTDFNGWQTAYGYDNGQSRQRYLDAFARFRRNLSQARGQLTAPGEVAVLDRIAAAANDFARLDRDSWAALQAGRTEEVKRILLGPEIVNFHRAARASQALSDLEDARVSRQDRAFQNARTDALRLLVGASIVAGLLVVILLVTATDLARRAEGALEETEGDSPEERPGTCRTLGVHGPRDRRRAARLVDDEHVAVRAMEHALAHARPEHPLEEAELSRSHDDQVGVALLGELDDRLGRVTEGGHRLHLEAVLGELRLRVVELFSVELRRIRRIDRPAPARSRGTGLCDARHDQRRPERLRLLGSPLQSPLGRRSLVVPEDDGLHRRLLSLRMIAPADESKPEDPRT